MADELARAAWRSATHLSLREWRAITQKGRGEIFLLSQHIYRPITAHISRFYARLGLSANTATFHSLVAALVAAGVLIWPSRVTFLISAVALQVYFVLDHVDGELARLAFWSGVRKPTPDGEYFDFWVHFHSMNLTFAALGIGLTHATGAVYWAIAGLIVDNVLGNFPKLALSRVLWATYKRDRAITTTPEFLHLVDVATDSDSTQIHDDTLTTRRRLFLLAREALFFPGCLVLLTMILVIDALRGAADNPAAFLPFSGVYLALLAVVGIASKTRRTMLAMRSLHRLSPNAAASTAESASGAQRAPEQARR